MKTRLCIAGDHVVAGDDADLMGSDNGEGFVCTDCASDDAHDIDDEDDEPAMVFCEGCDVEFERDPNVDYDGEYYCPKCRIAD